MTATPPTVLAALTAMTTADATRPLITFYDDASGERLDLSGATLGNWVAKTANLLVDGAGLGRGDVAAVRLPPHWLTAAVVLGCWSAGLAVGSGSGAVGFVGPDGTVEADDVYALALAPMGAPFRPGPPPGTLDYVVEVRPFGDQFTSSVSGADRALADGTTHAALAAAAPPVPGPRVLIDAAHAGAGWTWLVAPIIGGASIVLCANLDPARVERRLATEHAVVWVPLPA